ncbi:alpha/beta hydrolase [Ilyomonas limi]|uniref:Alpha/beta hydrolase n=1 Tax=Ilyomonas limi TaxID=2575867 RepID=A0A4U3L6T8_9BACT|nr:alpha/beta hydrolase [Ilyomonas limi]TKK70149.1 alpha/beta hydrolase [Ilyomonas limi]
MQNNLAYYPTTLSRKAITLVAHGLNMKPAGMLAIIQWLNEQGSDVYLVKLSGHHEQSIHIKHVTPTMWEEEMLHVYTIAKAASIQHNMPLFFVGYSLGALLGQAMILSLKRTNVFDKQILIAPATAVRNRSYVLKLFSFAYKKMMLPSFTPSPYRVHNFLPLTVFEVLFRNERTIVEAQFNTLNIPTLIFIDPKDELISYKKLVKFSRIFQLTNHEIIALDSNLKKRNAHYHHLVVSEGTMGKQNWEMVTQKMIAFLFGAEK